MKNWMLCGALDEWGASREYCGFRTRTERATVALGDRIIYFCNGLVVGVFGAGKFVENESAGLRQKPFQIRLKEIALPQHGLVAGPLHYKTSLQKHVQGSPTLWEISEWEYNKIMQALSEGHKELMF